MLQDKEIQKNQDKSLAHASETTKP